MGTGLYIIYAVIIACVVLPFILFITGSRKRNRQLTKVLQSEATRQNNKLDKIEVNNSFAIGLDTNAQKLFFHKSTATKEYTQSVDLTTVEHCDFLKVTRAITTKTKREEIIEKLILSFTHHHHKENSVLEFYNHEDEMILSDEVLMGEKWKQEINTLLASKPEALAMA